MNLREYQEKLVLNTAVQLRTHRKVVAQLATGGGKTVIFCAISKRYIVKNPVKSVLILVHRKELLAQTRRTAYKAFGLECQPIIAGTKYIPPADIYVGMVESVNRRILKLANIGLVIIDECHNASFNKMHDHFTSQYIIGFTATPLSNNKKKPLKMFYDQIICGADIPELIAAGNLCQNVTWAPREVVDRLNLEMKGDDFDELKMAREYRKPKYISNTVDAYKRWCIGKKTIIFNVNIFHNTEVCKAFVAAGFDCRTLDSENNTDERTKILYWFKNTPTAILCNVGIATTGFDEPTIENVMVNKATASMPLWLQMGGRGGRPINSDVIDGIQGEYTYDLLPKHMFTIIDMGGNAVTHGDWCYSRNWVDIFNNPPKPGKATAAPAKSCPNCDAIIPASARICPFCGYVYPARAIPIEIELSDFIVMTKNVDVDGLIAENKFRKEYYPFFAIGKQLAENAKKTVPIMSDDIAIFILQKYFELGKEWTKATNKRFNKWHQDKATETLKSYLQQKYPTWETNLWQQSQTV